MKGITSTSNITLKRGDKTSSPFIKLIKHSFNKEHKRIDCVVCVFESEGTYDSNMDKAIAISSAAETIASYRDSIKAMMKEHKESRDKENEKLKSKLIPIAISIKEQLNIITDEEKKDSPDEKVLKAAGSEIGNQKAKEEKALSIYEKALSPIVNKINDGKKNIDKLIQGASKLPHCESIDTKQYPSFDSNKDLDEAGVYELLKKQYKGVKVV